MAKTALIILDIQTGIVEMLKGVLDTDQYLTKISSTAAKAREAGIPVIQVTSMYRQTLSFPTFIRLGLLISFHALSMFSK